MYQTSSLDYPIGTKMSKRVSRDILLLGVGDGYVESVEDICGISPYYYCLGSSGSRYEYTACCQAALDLISHSLQNVLNVFLHSLSDFSLERTTKTELRCKPYPVAQSIRSFGASSPSVVSLPICRLSYTLSSVT